MRTQKIRIFGSKSYALSYAENFFSPIHPFWVVMDSRGLGNLKKVICRLFFFFLENFILRIPVRTFNAHWTPKKIRVFYVNFKYSLWTIKFWLFKLRISNTLFDRASFPPVPVFRQFSTFKVRISSTQKKHYLFFMFKLHILNTLLKHYVFCIPGTFVGNVKAWALMFLTMSF